MTEELKVFNYILFPVIIGALIVVLGSVIYQSLFVALTEYELIDILALLFLSAIILLFLWLVGFIAWIIFPRALIRLGEKNV